MFSVFLALRFRVHLSLIQAFGILRPLRGHGWYKLQASDVWCLQGTNIYTMSYVLSIRGYHFVPAANEWYIKDWFDNIKVVWGIGIATIKIGWLWYLPIFISFTRVRRHLYIETTPDDHQACCPLNTTDTTPKFTENSYIYPHVHALGVTVHAAAAATLSLSITWWHGNTFRVRGIHQ